MREAPGFVYHDGGRKAAGFRGTTGDCVTRAIAIASGVPYREVYDELFRRAKARKTEGEIPESVLRELPPDRARRIKAARTRRNSPRNGVGREVYEPYLLELGFAFEATMGIGTGCRVHLRADELPSGRLVCRLSRHLVAVVDGVVFDTYDPRRGGTRCVYGFYAASA